MELRLFQKGFNYAQDGRGNRLVYHLQGCDLACPWCANPEGMPHKGGIGVSVEALADEAERCRAMFFDGGGVTFTGGECTCQFAPLKAALTLLRQRGIGTAIETNGTAARLPELFPLLDELIMDCKHHDSEIHRRFTGMGNEQIVQNLRAALTACPCVLVRIPLIHGFNASAEDMERFAALFGQCDGARIRFEPLPYHEYGREKWEKCGRPYTFRDGFVTEEERQRYEQILRSHGLSVVHT